MSEIANLCKEHGTVLGFAVAKGHEIDPVKGVLLKEHAGALVVEHEASMDKVLPMPKVVDFSRARHIYEHAKKNNLYLHMTNLIWFLGFPKGYDSLMEASSQYKREMILRRWVELYTLNLLPPFTSYPDAWTRGKVSVDIGNEMYTMVDGQLDYRDSPWSRHLWGMEKEAALTVNALSQYCQRYYNCSTPQGNMPALFDEELRRASNFFVEGIAHGVGLQMHLRQGPGINYEFIYRSGIECCVNMGMKIRFSEIGLIGDDAWVRAQSKMIGNLVKDYHPMQAVWWGTSEPGWNNERLMFDVNGNPTVVYEGFMEGLT